MPFPSSLFVVWCTVVSVLRAASVFIKKPAMNSEFLIYLQFFLKGKNHLSMHNSCFLISASQLYVCSSYIVNDSHKNGNYFFTLKKSNLTVTKHPKHSRISSGSLLDPVTILAAQFIEISITQAPLISKSSQSPFYSGSQPLKNLTVFHTALAPSLSHSSSIGPTWEIVVAQPDSKYTPEPSWNIEILRWHFFQTYYT